MKPPDEDVPDPMPLPEWPEGQSGAASDSGEDDSQELPGQPEATSPPAEGASWGDRWRSNAERRDEWFRSRRGGGVERFDVRGGEVVPSVTEQPTAGAESQAEILKRIEQQLSSIAEMLRQII